MFVDGKIETYYFVIDTAEKLGSLPLATLNSVIKKMSEVYSMRLEKLLVLNVNLAIKFTYKAVSQFLS
jgi:hypothetical protein